MTKDIQINKIEKAFNLLKLAIGGNIKWKELINPRKDREAKYMVSEKEWLQRPEETYLREEEQKVVINFPRNRAKVTVFAFSWAVYKWITD